MEEDHHTTEIFLSSRSPQNPGHSETGCSRYGQGSRCSKLQVFCGFFSIAAIFTSSIGMYVNSQVTTLERQFGFSSSQVGFILSCNEIGFLVTTLFISHQARRLHIPRSLSVSTILFGLSGLICVVAYVASPSFAADGIFSQDIHEMTNTSTVTSPVNRRTQLCRDKQEVENCANITGSMANVSGVGKPNSFTLKALLILAIGMILQGVGKAPRQPFITCYVDDNVEKTKTALYLGVIATVSLLGPALGFGVGGVFTKMFVTLEDVSITPSDPRWIGAWWMGFVVLGSASILAGIPLFFFPKIIQPNIDTSSEENVRFITSMKGFGTSLRKLVTNRMYMLLVLSLCLNLFVMTGSMVFLPKYFEVQFSVPTWTANIIMGTMTLVSAGFGTMLGGVLTSKFKLSPLACAKLITALSVLSVFCPLVAMFLGCKNPIIIGHSYESAPLIIDNTVQHCSGSCFCDEENYFPVCGADNRMFFSPCHAGCITENNKTFTGCSCIPGNGTAIPGLCPAGCWSMVYPYVAVTMLAGIFFTLTSIPTLIFSIRCVSEREKSLAVGLSTFFQTLIGWLPGPIVFGKIVDTSCLHWTSSCHGKGACVLYDIEDFRYKRNGVELGVKMLVLFMHILMYRIALRTDWKKILVDKIPTKESEILLSNNMSLNHTDLSLNAL